jgi:hypothetical protein
VEKIEKRWRRILRNWRCESFFCSYGPAVDRTLLSAGIEFYFFGDLGRIHTNVHTNVHVHTNIHINGGGQECPPYYFGGSQSQG